jgi:Asp-tRNA(Asn)/Glu-tRNA(Gln) amidotransferase A subunit family amidase
VRLAELAAAVREGRTSAKELIGLAYERIERLNDDLNAVIALRPQEEAFAEAEVLEATAASAAVGVHPLLGLPLLVKDNTDVKGMRTTNGSRLLLDAAPAASDARVVAHLRAAGAIVVGRTNVPEFSFSGFTDNAVYGPARNPWGTEWSPGGSSGGSGAALAAGMAPLATGTDGGGSVRIPAALCGLAGLKPTSGLVGRWPVPSWMDLSTDGPLGHTIADVRLLLDVMRGQEAGDIASAAQWDPRAGGTSRASRVIAATRTWDWGPLPPGMDERYRAALSSIERDLSLPVEEVEASSLFTFGGDPAQDWFAIVAVEELQWIGRERILANMDELSPGFRPNMEYALGVSVDRYVEARRNRFAYARAMDELLGEDAVFVCPTLGYEGWLANGNLLGSDEGAGGEGYNNGEANLSGHPALSVPAGLSANGIPFGLQVTGPRWRDDLVLSFGETWEEANPWPETAPGYERFEP